MDNLIKQIDNSIDNFFKTHKDKSIEEIAEKFIEKYKKAYEKLEEVKENYNKTATEIQSAYYAKYKEYENRKDKEVAELKRKEQFINDTGEKLYKFFKVLEDFHKSRISEKNKWLNNPVCNNPEFNRGFFACWNNFNEFIRTDLLGEEANEIEGYEILYMKFDKIMGDGFGV